MTIRWEEQDNGDWHGLSGELIVAVVVPDRVGKASADDVKAAAKAAASARKTIPKRWLWEVTVQRPPGWRNEGHRTSALAARRAADDYWARWCEAAALKPDIERLVAESDEPEPGPTARKKRAKV
jgi:hypothetical protein